METRREAHGTSGVSGKNVAVVGLGASGMAAARLVLAKGGEVYVSDVRTDAQTTARGTELRDRGAEVDLGRHDVERVAGADLVVVSPGIPPDAPVLRSLSSRGVRWISEPELAVRFFAGPLIAVTGTNGKTTTTVLISHLLETAGRRVALGGNVGGGMAPAASELALREPAPDWYVLELSSFQLSGIEQLRPDIGVVTNLSPDHLDRYATVEEYYADKAHLFDNADHESRWVLPGEDPTVEDLIGETPGRRYRFGEDGAAGVHAYVENDVLTLRRRTEAQAVLPVHELPLLGRHNRMNALAAMLAASLAGSDVDSLAEGLRCAKALPHRMEPLVERRGVLWVNDSKATNVAATRSALRSLERPVILLVGGKDKGESFGTLRTACSSGVRHVLAFGAARVRIATELEGAAPLELVEGSLEDVVRRASELAHEGDVVLLSPACSSFDMFENYEDRGRRFAALAREMA